MSKYISIQSIRPCIKCGSSAVFCESSLEVNKPDFFVLCHDCGHYKEEKAMTAQQAIVLWNTPQTIKPVRRYKDY
ncbi:Lar family restriction alleviation protein [Vibrio splendidus]|uniref:Lar family restriction alleviation protein n=1 Tax=Vibrio splendidus TaxID=29497 RepID=UPI000C8344A0|nr:Lar family restriction alleviation protein [Vibrio splendidus]PMI75008.1 hypothetical protein BCU38_12685 [Vibrio splendidus]